MPLDIAQSLGKKVGPLPLGAWALIAGGGLGVIVLLRKKSSGGVPVYDVSPDSLVAITRTSPGYIPTPVPTFDTTPATKIGDDLGSVSQGSGGVVNLPSIGNPKTPPVQSTQPKDFGYNPAGKGTPQTPAKTPSSPSAPPAPAAPAPNYPGLPAGYYLNCATSYNGLHGSYETVLAAQRRKGNFGDTFFQRNMMAIALQGNTAPWIGRGDWNNPSLINTRRVANGLYPLTIDEIARAIAQINAWNNGDERAFLTHAKEFYDTWSVPYQCSGTNTIRRVR